MSPIIKRYCVCALIIVAIILYILYYFGNGDLGDYAESNQFVEIGFTRVAVEEFDEVPATVNSKILVNLTNFEYKIVPKCHDEANGKILGIIIVTTYVGHDEVRSAHRSAMSQNDLKRLGFIRVFLLAAIPPHEQFITQNAVESESLQFNDIVQGNFVEAYRNLTYKHVMGLKWASTQNCHQNQYIIKMDDDIVVDFFYLSSYLHGITGHGDHFLAGFVLGGVQPIRLRQNKWFVSYEEYAGDIYPDYLSGWMYVIAPATAKCLVRAATQAMPPFFWIDDTWVTGVLRTNQHIKINETWNSLYSANSQFLDCCLNDLKQHRYRCPFLAGPNGGDHKLITKFLQEYRKQCFLNDAGELIPMINNCQMRPVNRPPLTKTCVGVDKHLLVENHGAAIVNAMKL